MANFGDTITNFTSTARDKAGKGIKNAFEGAWSKDTDGAVEAGRAAAGGYINQPNMGVGQFNDSAYSGGQQRYDKFLNALSARNQPSMAALQQQQGLAQASRAAQSMAAGATGGNRALAGRQAMTAQSNMQTQGIQQGMIARMQEEQMRKQMFMQALNQSTGMGMQMQLGQEGIASQNYATAMGAEEEPGWLQKILGPAVSATGNVIAASIGKA